MTIWTQSLFGEIIVDFYPNLIHSRGIQTDFTIAAYHAMHIQV